MTEFLEQINKYNQLTKEAEKDFLSRLKTKSFKKGEFINKEGQICKQLYFIEKGLVKQYYHHKDRLFVLRFFSENTIFTVLDSFINQMPADFLTVALEDTNLIYIDYDNVQELSKIDHSFETFLRKIFSNAALYNLKRIKEMFNNDATELYVSFAKNNPHLLQRISLGDIASYIGISQVTLSRIRAKK
ncbi:Crp/Fnr family transcriptional regulator [Flavobacterium luteum]|uniref:Crp/Fnr family transcriptional regulator n=1 Tax=Flavobacterium luteum TaxID=2026654 RepID=A0A7J5AKJ4_9FLAO|nr:Crp/Fnr family transcriptional regulator [Flavobacterium luteum]KAB1158127.1 Crp/Fnr family transcriptional regulator [Flavobacterium luteum]